MSAQTLAEKSPETLQQFLVAFPGSWEAQLFLGLMLAGFIGMSANYAVKWARDEVNGNLLCYFANNFRTVCLSIFVYVGIAIAAIASGAFIGSYGGFVGWKTVFWLGITNGFTIDAIVNRTERARWTPVERELKRNGSSRR